MTRVNELPEPSSPNGKEVVVPATREDWRSWLDAHPDRTQGVWVVFRKSKSDLEGPVYEDLVEEALCFGWIDSLTKRVDDHRTIQWYSPRRPGGIWARANKERVDRLVAEGAMTLRGQAVIDAARADGSWTRYDDVEALVVPPDLESAFEAAPEARAAFAVLSKSAQRLHLWSIYSAKRPETRERRVRALVVELTAAE